MAVAFAVLAAAPAGAQSLTDLLKSVAGRVKGGDSVQNVIQQLSSINTASVTRRDDTLGVASGDQVIFYSASWCSICKQAREYMRSKSVPFAEYDVETSDKGKADIKALNARGVPVMLLGEQKLMGFQPAQFDAAYASFRASDHHAGASADGGAAGATGTVGAKVGNVSAGGYDAGVVLVPKIGGVKVFDQPTEGSAALFTLSKADEVVYLGEERAGFLKVQGASGTGWVQALMVRK
jgi:glutaredoxin